MKKIREALQDAYKYRDYLIEEMKNHHLDPKDYQSLKLDEIENDGFIRGLEFALFSLHDEQ